jgi:hypothetical protein
MLQNRAIVARASASGGVRPLALRCAPSRSLPCSAALIGPRAHRRDWRRGCLLTGFKRSRDGQRCWRRQ